MTSKLVGGVGSTVIAVSGLAMTLLVILNGPGADVVIVSVTPWYLVGAFLVLRRPENVMGWLFSAVGLLWTSGTVTSDHAEQIVDRATPWLGLMSWYSDWYFVPAIGLPIVILMIFPTGRAPSPRWRPALILVVVGLVAATSRIAFASEVQAGNAGLVVENPVGIGALGLTTGSGESPILLFLLAAGLTALAAFVVRFRRSEGVESQQLKWMILAAPALVLGWVLGGLTAEYTGLIAVSNLLYGTALAAVPLAAGVAITRFHLYDIDRILSRTTSYALVTGLLLVVYVSVVWAVPQLLPEANDLAVAAATLAAAALFRPLLSRVRGVVDRRFDRSRYDADRAVEEFAVRLRDEVDTETVVEELVDVVQRSLEPSILVLATKRGLT
jgi:hypothetical protein